MNLKKRATKFVMNVLDNLGITKRLSRGWINWRKCFRAGVAINIARLLQSFIIALDKFHTRFAVIAITARYCWKRLRTKLQKQIYVRGFMQKHEFVQKCALRLAQPAARALPVINT